MTTVPHRRKDPGATRTGGQKAAVGAGVVFLLAGVLGFIPGITTEYGDMAFAGHHSEAMLLGVFRVSILHNLVHLLFGLAGIALARSHRGARNYLIWGGMFYLLLALYGLLTGQDPASNFLPLNDADNWLHLILGIGMLVLGLMLARNPQSDSTNISLPRWW